MTFNNRRFQTEDRLRELRNDKIVLEEKLKALRAMTPQEYWIATLIQETEAQLKITDRELEEALKQ